tara:strand:+ start:4419 stop:5291 length:873 start_codon:yes stop_codon:yes gene_type:complete
MIILILVHKHLRKTLDIIDIANRNSSVVKIYLLLSNDTEINNERLNKYLKDYHSKIISINHKYEGIKGAWLRAMEIGASENSDFLIFENDIIPTSFFLDYSKLAFSFYRNENKIYGFTGYTPKRITKISFDLDTFLSYRFGSWSFATYPRIAKKFLIFIKETPINKIGEILWKNKSKIGKDAYFHYLSDQSLNRNLFGYIWIAFMISNKGLWLYPSEHLVSCYGNDKYATNVKSGKDILSKYKNLNFNQVRINFMPVNNFSKKHNKKVINFYYPNILHRLINKIKKIITS